MRNTWLKKTLAGLAALGLALCSSGLMAAEEGSGVDEMEDLRGMLGSVTAQMNDLKDKSDKTGYFNFNADLRYDQQYYKAAGTIANNTLANPLVTFPADASGHNLPSGAAGMYAKRVEVYFKRDLAPDVKVGFQYEFAGNKLEEVLLEFDNLTLLPFTDISGWNYNLIIGQMRQHFGIENQTGSSSVYFSERAMMYGGANPWGLGKLVTERVMGLHFTHKKDLGFFTYDIGADVANDATEDQTAGQTSLTGAFPKQALDQDPSEEGRLGIEPTILNSLLPLDMKFKFAGLAIHDPQNTVYLSSSNTSQTSVDTAGFDGTFEMMKEVLKVQSEWVGQNKFAGMVALQGHQSGFVSRAEGWYLTTSIQPLKLFLSDAPKVELLGRLESYVPNVDQANLSAIEFPTSYNANTIGLKYTYLGNNQTSINYTTYGLSSNYGVMGATELVTVQQQINF